MMKTVYVVKSQTSSGISKNYGSYHFPLTARPPTKMAEKIAAKNKNVSQIGLSTHNQDHEINPVAFNTTSTSVKATIGSIPDRPDRLDFFSIHISPRKFDLLWYVEYIIFSNQRTSLYDFATAPCRLAAKIVIYNVINEIQNIVDMVNGIP